MTVQQIKVGTDNFSYLIYCPENNKAALVDPSYNPKKIIEAINALSLKLEYILFTHHHYDHINATQQIQSIYQLKTIASIDESKYFDFKIDITISDQEQLQLGDIQLTFLLTPGHTPGSICILIDDDAILTGDTLFIDDCGRTDLPGGSIIQMFNTLHNVIMNLPGKLIIYPGHDYGNKPYDTLEKQKKTNKTLLANTVEELSMIP
jgi:glyoxylase-like metal-dependent hydrolase (beta-lactamase superfamily II)